MHSFERTFRNRGNNGQISDRFSSRFYWYQVRTISSINGKSKSFLFNKGVVRLGGHFATLCHEVDFNEAFIFINNFQKEKATTFTLLIILILKSLKIGLHIIAQICCFDPQSARINVQSPQSASTPRRLTLF